ncbi:ermin [Tiliqua scincoides]|uniref:ermin n=1 Tax=Tiliqua scincoides TaxID=71010 RepID=UPI0034630A7A
MTEDIPIPASIPEYNRNVPSEKPPLQVIDIIDQIASSVEIFPYENTEPNPGSLLTQDNQEGVNHLVKNTAFQVSGGEKEPQGKQPKNKEKKADISPQETRAWEKEPGEGLSVRTKEHKVTELEGTKMQQLWDETVYCTDEVDEDQEGVQLDEPEEQLKEETDLDAHENSTEAGPDGAEEGMLKESHGMSHKKGLENKSKESLPTSPTSNFQSERCNEQPGTMKKNDISRHSYSRYNTISYRKIRKGNTKQRIDEFESMMHS